MDYKIFTEEEFNQRVELFWKLMVQSEFPDIECLPIEHDRAKRRTSNLGMAHFNIKYGDTKLITLDKLSFSFRVLDGRFTLRCIDETIKHEIGHCLHVLRFGDMDNHDKEYIKIAEEFDFDYLGTTSEAEDASEIYHTIINKNLKYVLMCSCGQTYAYGRKRAMISRMIKKGHAIGQVACHKCGNDKLTLYIFENGIIYDLSKVDCELYYQTFGGVKL